MTNRTSVLVVCGGGPPAVAALVSLPADRYVIAADSGLDYALAAGLRVDLVVGDLDSVSPEGLAAAQAVGVAVEHHPVAKDETDLELALDRALGRRPAHVIVVGGAGGRFDHVLANALVLASERYAAAAVEGRFGTARVTVVRDRATLAGRPGNLVSLLSVDGSALGVTTEGLLYPLADEGLDAGSSRGVSNQFLTAEATVTVRSGVLLAVEPDAFG